MNKLWLIWQNEDSSKKYHVGTLSKSNDAYYFEYSNKQKFRGLEEAQKNGYTYLFPFKDMTKIYKRKSLFPTFIKRLPNKNRPDYVNLLNRFGLDENASDMEILRITKGKTGVDNYEFITPLKVEGSKLDTHFFIEGARHYDFKEIENQENYFKKHSKLKLKNDPMQHDSTAIKILSHDNHVLGYMPAVYSKVLTEIMQHVELELHVDHVNLDTLSQLTLYLRIEAEIPRHILKKYKNEFEIINTEIRV